MSANVLFVHNVLHDARGDCNLGWGKNLHSYPAMADAPRGRGRGRPPRKSRGLPRSTNVDTSGKLPKTQRERKRWSGNYVAQKLAVGLDVSDTESDDGERAKAGE